MSIIPLTEERRLLTSRIAKISISKGLTPSQKCSGCIGADIKAGGCFSLLSFLLFIMDGMLELWDRV
ncbi:uncharacterized [Tachysurus ichikawai]